MTIRPDRIAADLDHIAAITETPGRGSSRPTFTPHWAKARDYVIAQAQAAGCEVRIDAAGNVHARPAALGWDAAAWLSGSHIDTVPHGGKFDGVVGVVVPLEVLRAAHEAKRGIPLELVIFTEEEGTTFNLGMLGSRAWARTLSAGELAKVTNRDGVSFIDAGRPYGVIADQIGSEGIGAMKYLGMIEVHVEQGPAMWEQNVPVALVTAINGRMQFRVTVGGVANHAGSTPMSYRQDAMAGFAEMAVALERLPATFSPQTVLTIGQIAAQPNVMNVIPDRVTFTIDFRAPTDHLLARGLKDIERTIQAIAARRKLTVDVQTIESLPAVAMDDYVLAALRRAVTWAGLDRLAETTSGALHDAAIVAPLIQAAMLFVASKDGISHNPAEHSRIEDIAQAAEVLAALLAMPMTLEQMNGASVDDFVRVCGHLFEHSPWVAERAAVKRPFAHVGTMYSELVETVKQASEAEQLALIRAHPDLVGRLAREGRLTQDSTAEQAAAGLATLGKNEIAQFEAYNAAYREKFGFPFIMFARGNNKQSIRAAFPERLKNTREAEIATALDEIFKIAWSRLNAMIGL